VKDGPPHIYAPDAMLKWVATSDFANVLLSQIGKSDKRTTIKRNEAGQGYDPEEDTAAVIHANHVHKRGEDLHREKKNGNIAGRLGAETDQGEGDVRLRRRNEVAEWKPAQCRKREIPMALSPQG